MGLFDISQCISSLANYLSMTMPYVLWEQMTKDLDKSFFTTNSCMKLKKDYSIYFNYQATIYKTININYTYHKVVKYIYNIKNSLI